MTGTNANSHIRILALLQAKNEERFLPGWLENVQPAVDGIIALNDGSTDKTRELLAAAPKTIEILDNPPGGAWNERANQMALVQAGRRHGAEWLLCLDADERLEMHFVEQVQELLAQAEVDGIQVYQFQLRDLWGDARHYRVDGLWNNKAVTRLFKNVSAHKRFDPRELHRFWVPLEIVSNLETVGRHSKLNIYHLNMITPQEREARVAKYERIDPQHRYQRVGYRYLTDETNLALETIPPERGFYPSHDAAFDTVQGMSQ